MVQSSYTYRPVHFWYLMLALAFMLFFRLGASPIYILDEAKNAQCAREMLLHDDWIVPTFNNELRTDKPVLHYYFMMVAYTLFGVNEIAARFFSAIMGLCTVATVFFFSKKFIGELSAMATALVLVASTHFIFEFRLSVPDPYLIFFTSAGLLLAYVYLQNKDLKVLLTAAICFALATLAKGPVAITLPGLCLLVWVGIKKKWEYIFTWKIGVALAVLLSVMMPWYVAVHFATDGSWTKGFFLEHNLNRFSDTQEGHGGTFLITILFAVIGLLPFTTFLGEIFKQRKTVFTPDLVKFSGIVVLAFLIFFSLSKTRLPNYAMPCYPFAAIIMGHYIAATIQRKVALKIYPVYILLFITILISVAAYVLIGREPGVAAFKNFSLILFAGSFCILLLLAAFNQLSSIKQFAGIVIAYSFFNGLLLFVLYPVLYNQNPVAKSIELVKKYPSVFSYKLYNAGYNFYLDKPVTKFFDIESLEKAIQKVPNTIILVRKEYAVDLQQLNLVQVGELRDLFEKPTTNIYVTGNQP